MKAFEQLERLQRINLLIKAEKTGTPEEFATKIGISTSHLYRCIDEIKEMGAPVIFSRTRRTYSYEKNLELKISYSVEVISEHSVKKISGGFDIRNSSLLFFESIEV